jgi:biopolymer transport protein ExbD
VRARKGPRSPAAGFDLSSFAPFADVAFLLIIFFLLTTELAKPAGRKLDIPAGRQDPTEQTEKQITVNLAAGGIYYRDSDRPITVDALRQALFEENLPAKPDTRRVVVLNSDHAVPYERYYQVVMAISQAGGFLALVEDESEETPG